MTIVARHKWEWDEVCGVFALLDPLLFALAFWEEDFTIPQSRTDLPKKWRGNQIISKEQRMMFYDGCVYRLWRDILPDAAQESSQKVAMRTSRKIGKTLYMESQLIQVAITNTVPGVTEGMFHTPRDNHMSPVINRTVKKIKSTPLFSLVFKTFDAASGIMNWRTGWIWHTRIEGMSGTGSNMVGLRAACMMGDEGDYSQSAPYIEREQTALPGCAQLWGGVPRGVRGEFWRICNTQAGKEWSIHRYDIRANALYHSQKSFGDQVKEDWYSQRVQTQVLGRDGEESVSSFPLVPVDAGSPYVIRKFSLTEYMKFKDGLPTFLNIPVSKIEDAVAWVIHLDYGYSPSPSQIGISYYRSGMWHLLCRIETLRIDTAPMANIIAAIDTGILPKRAALIVMDAHGQGRGVLSALQTDERWDQEDYANRALSVSFEGSTQIPDIKVHRKCRQAVRRDRQEEAYVCDTCHVMIYDDRELADASRQTKAYLTDELKEAFSNAARVLASNGKEWTGGVAIAIGDDAELVEELAGTTEVTSVTGQTRYNSPRDADHMTDMLRCLVSAASRYISLTSEWDTFKPSDYGWGENFTSGPIPSSVRGVPDNWLPPWAAAAQQKGW